MKTVMKFATVMLILAVVFGAGISAFQNAKAATGPICAQFGTTTQGNYTIMNNRWGTSATQCINVTTNGFQITQQDGTGNLSGAPVSYPAIYVGCHYSNCSPNTNLPKQISTIGTADTSVSLTLTSSGTYDAAYDIWLNADTNVTGVQDTEIMIWLHYQGSIQPIGSQVGSINLAGRTWQVWVGNNGANNVVSYRSSNITNFTADVKPFILDAITRGSNFGNTSWYLTSMQMGFEPWIGGVGLAVNSFSANITTGSGNQPTATRTNTPQANQPTATRTPTPQANQPTATRTPTQGSGGGACSPVTQTISVPFTKDGAGTFCYQASSLGSYVNSWNTNSVTINGVNFTNVWVGSGSYPAPVGGFYYIGYNSSVGWGHLEVR